jgi:hypothetical protein
MGEREGRLLDRLPHLNIYIYIYIYIIFQVFESVGLYRYDMEKEET